MNKSVRRLIDAGARHHAAKWLALGSVTGLGCGVLGLMFYWASDVLAHLLLRELAGYQAHRPAGELRFLEDSSVATLSPIILIVVLTLGGLLSGVIVRCGYQRAGGAGMGPVLEGFHAGRGRLPLSAPITKFFASVITLGSGGSAGREGPIALVGAGLGSMLGRRWNLSSRDRRILLAAGVAGGVAAVFRAPLAGAVFAAEVLYSDPDVEADVLIPSFISAIVSYCTFGVLQVAVMPGGFDVVASLFQVSPDLGFSASEVPHLIGYLLVALAVVALCRTFMLIFSTTEAGFARLPVPTWIRPAIGGLATALIGIGVLMLAWSFNWSERGDTTALATIGAGYGILQQAMEAGFGSGGAGVWLLLLIAFGKMVTSSCTVGSGGSGGLFGPSLVVGGCVGGAVGLALQGWAIAPRPESCVIMGMAGFLAAAYKTPIAALLMASELAGSYALLLPAMWVCALAYLLSGRRGLVSHQLRSQVDSPAHRGHFFNDILAGIRVHQVFDSKREVRTLQPSSSIDACKQLVTESHQTVYPVVDANGKLSGIFNLNDLRAFLFDDSLGLVAVAEDVATDDIITIRPKDSLATALRAFTVKNLEELPVVADDDPTRFLGLLTRRQAIAYYNQVVDEMRAARREEGWEQHEEPVSERHVHGVEQS